MEFPARVQTSELYESVKPRSRPRPGRPTSGKLQLKLFDSKSSPPVPVRLCGSSRAIAKSEAVTLSVGAVQASNSAIRTTPSAAPFTTTRILLVLIGAKLILRQTRLFVVTDPFGTNTQLLPFQYCTSKAVTP